MHLLRENERSKHEVIYKGPFFLSDIDLSFDVLMFHTIPTLSLYESKEKKLIGEVAVKIRKIECLVLLNDGVPISLHIVG